METSGESQLSVRQAIMVRETHSIPSSMTTSPTSLDITDTDISEKITVLKPNPEDHGEDENTTGVDVKVIDPTRGHFQNSPEDPYMGNIPQTMDELNKYESGNREHFPTSHNGSYLKGMKNQLDDPKDKHREPKKIRSEFPIMSKD